MDNIETLYKKAHEAKQKGDITLLRQYYKSINEIDPDNWEAKFCLTYYKAMEAKEKDFWSESIAVMNVEREIFATIKKGIDKSEEPIAIKSIYTGICEISKKFTHDTKHSFARKDNETRNENISEYVGKLSIASELLYSCGDEIESCFGDKYYSYAVDTWKKAIEINTTYVKYVLNKKEHSKTIDKYAEKILKLDKDYKKPEIELLSASTSSFTSKLKKFINNFK